MEGYPKKKISNNDKKQHKQQVLSSEISEAEIIVDAENINLEQQSLFYANKISKDSVEGISRQSSLFHNA